MTPSRSRIVAAATLGLLLLAVAPVRADDLGENPEVIWSLPTEPDLLAKANELATPVQIYEFVRNEVAYAAYQGARSSSVNSFLGRIGNDVDTASTLIAMLRSQGIRARYAVATVRAPAADVMSWLGVRDPQLAASVLDDQGIQHVALTAGNTAVEFEHVWVQAFLPLDEYRAAGPATVIDCVSTPSDCQWVNLAPAFKRKSQKNPATLIDVYNTVPFDYDAYYNALNPSAPPPADGIDRADKNPLEIYEEQIQGYLRTNDPGKTLEDVADDGEIVPEQRDLLPESLPFEVISPVQTYDSVAEHDAVPGNKRWAKYVQINLIFDGVTISLFDAQVSLAQLSTQRLTLSLVSGPSGSNFALRLGGNALWSIQASGQVIINGVPLTVGTPFDLHLRLDGPPDTTGTGSDEVIDRTYQNLVVGGYYAISTGGETSNFSRVHRAARELLDANEQYPIVLDANGDPYVDTNGDGSYTAGTDVALLDDPAAMDALTGGLLFTAQELYFAKLRDARDRLQALDHVISPIAGFLGVVSSSQALQYLGDTSYSIMPDGLLIDMKGVLINGSWRNDQPAQTAPAHFELFGHVGSSLEHEVWQEITGFDALSTVRGIQFALRDGATLIDAKKNATEDTLPDHYGDLGFSVGSAPSPWVRADFSLFGDEPTTWYPNPDPGPITMDVLQGSVDLSTPSLRTQRLIWDNQSYVYENIKAYDDLENQLLAYPVGVIFTFTCDGQSHSGTGQEMLPVLEVCWNDYKASLPQAFFDYIDKAQGFVPGDYVYRNAATVDMHDTSFVQDIRNDLYLRDFNDQWVEYVLPSRRTSTIGPSLFSVDLRKQYDAATGELLDETYSIQNLSGLVAGGGYVNSDQPLQLTNTNVFNNQELTDQNLIRTTNNDVIKTPSTADPVSTVTGNNFLDEKDISIKGRGLDLVFTRTYNSGAVKNAGTGKPLSPGWTHSYAMRLHSNDYGRLPDADATQAPENFNGTTSSITYTDERGGEVNYLVDDTGGSPTYAVSPPTGVFDSLALDTPTTGEATLRFRNGTKYVFDAQGADLRNPGVTARLKAIQDPYGNEIDLSYDTAGRLVNVDDNVNDASRTGLTFAYNADDRIQTISDWTGRNWTYGYDAQGNLTTYTNPDGDVLTYVYGGTDGLLENVILPEVRDGKHVETSFQYYRNAKTFTNRNALGFGETLDYDLYRKRTRVEDPRGFVQEHYYDANGLLVKRVRADGGVQFFENTPDLLRFKKTDALGFTTTYSYLQNDLADGKIDGGPSDTFGNVVLEQDALGNTIDTQYDFDHYDQPTSIKDKNGAVRNFTYYTGVDDDTTGKKVGKLAEVRLAQLGADSDVLLRKFTYNSDGTVRAKIEYLDASDPSRTRTTSFTYTDDNLNVSQILVTGSDGTSRKKTFTYDALGRKKTETLWRATSPTDPTQIELTTTYDYDGLDRVVLKRDPLGNERVPVYDHDGKIKEIDVRYKQPDGSFVTRVVEQRSYDAADRVAVVTDVLGGQTRFEYDEAGNTTRITDPTGASVQFEYDAMGRRTAVIDKNGHRSETVYDQDGRVVAETDANGHSTTYTYDALGRRTSRVDALGNETTFAYDPNGNQTEMTDPRGQLDPTLRNSQGVTEFREYDELGRVTRILDAKDGETRFEYDLLGDRTKVTDAKMQVTQFVYDDLGRQTEVIDPVIETPVDKRQTFQYDEADNRIVATDRDGHETQLTYDELNRLTQKHYLTSGDVQTTTYDPFGDMVSMADPEVTYTFTYDQKHRLLSKTDSRLGHSLQFAYDAADRLIQKTDYQGDVTNFLYDGTGRLVAEQNPDYVQVSYHYDPAGRLLNRILSNGARTDYTYDAANRLATLKTSSSDGTSVVTTAYTYDADGNVTHTDSTANGPTQTGVTSGTATYGYDALNRLTSADYPGTGADRTYEYDAVGNRTLRTIGTATYQYDVGPGNRLLDVNLDSGGGSGLLESFDYDANGAVTAKRDQNGAAILTFTRNDRGQVTAITGSGFSDQFGYDPRDLRVRRDDSDGSHLFHLDGDGLEAVYDAAGTLRAKYLRGAVIDEVVNGYVKDQGKLANVTFHHDQVNSVVGLTGPNGALEAGLALSPFGNVLWDDPSGFGDGNAGPTDDLRFTGRERDHDTKLYYYRARYYDPDLGRFLSEDPKGFDAGIDFYTYVGNNPLLSNDPNGQCPWCLVTGLIGAGGAVVATCWNSCSLGQAAAAGGAGFLVGSGLELLAPFVAPVLAMTGGGAAAAGDLLMAGGAAVGGNALEQTGDIWLSGGTLSNDFSFRQSEIAFGAGTLGAVPEALGAYGAATALETTGLGTSSFLGEQVLETPPIEQIFTAGLTTSLQIAGMAEFGGNAESGGSEGSSSSSLSGVIGFGPAGPAAGGFVLYPSRPNLNQAAVVYSKQ